MNPAELSEAQFAQIVTDAGVTLEQYDLSPVAGAMVGAINAGVSSALSAGQGAGAGLQFAAGAIASVAAQYYGAALGSFIPMVGGVVTLLAETPAAGATDKLPQVFAQYCQGYDGTVWPTGAQGSVGADWFLSPYATPGVAKADFPSPPWRSPIAQSSWAMFETRLWDPFHTTRLAGLKPSDRKAFRRVRRAVSACWGRPGTDGGDAFWFVWADMLHRAISATPARELEALYVNDGIGASTTEEDPDFGLVGHRVHAINAGCALNQAIGAAAVLSKGWGAQNQAIGAAIEECGFLGTLSCPSYTRAPLDSLLEVSRRWGNIIAPVYQQDVAFAAHLNDVVKETTKLPIRPKPKPTRPAVRPRRSAAVPLALGGIGIASGLGYAVATGAATRWWRAARRAVTR